MVSIPIEYVSSNFNLDFIIVRTRSLIFTDILKTAYMVFLRAVSVTLSTNKLANWEVPVPHLSYLYSEHFFYPQMIVC